jgi:hypothetical protein
MRSPSLSKISVPAALILVSCTGCPSGDCNRSGVHATLSSWLGLAPGTALDQEVIQTALDEKFPAGTAYDEVLAKVPPTEETQGEFLQWSPWNVATLGDKEISIWSGEPRCNPQFLECGFGIVMRFDNGKLTSIDVIPGCQGM